MMTQRQWRLLGGLTLALASSMAVVAVLTDVLRNSAMVLIAPFSPRVAEEAAGIARWPLAAFWALFGMLMVATLYFAMIDIRHIRLQYAEERRRILKRTLEDEGFRETLRERTTPGGPQHPSRNGR